MSGAFNRILRIKFDQWRRNVVVKEEKENMMERMIQKRDMKNKREAFNKLMK